jgi:hypothetical protein
MSPPDEESNVEDQNGFGIRLSHPGEQELAKHRCSRSTREGSRDTRRQTSIQTSPKSFAPSRIPAPSRSPTLPTPSPDDRPGSLDPKQSQQTRLTMMSIRPNDQTTKRPNDQTSKWQEIEFDERAEDRPSSSWKGGEERRSVSCDILPCELVSTYRFYAERRERRG